jgi:GTP-dependent phosphoenolpyruvate carboxykinase
MHKIHAFVEMQENRSKLHNFFHQAEMNALLKDCEAGLAQGREFFQVIHSIGRNNKISFEEPFFTD